MVLGVTIAAEVVGKVVLNKGLATQVRPRRYYTVPRETLDILIGDVHELVNFFVIEAQRVIFAENVFASLAVRVHFELLECFKADHIIGLRRCLRLVLLGQACSLLGSCRHCYHCCFPGSPDLHL